MPETSPNIPSQPVIVYDANGSVVSTQTTGTPASASPENATQVGGTDGTNLRVLSVDTTGKLNLNNISGTISIPTGASTAANQATAIASLASMDGKFNSLGQKTMAGSTPVVFASDQTAISVSPSSQRNTYTASVTGLVPAATPTDIFVITGSGSKTVKIIQFQITATRTSSTTSDILLIKRSTDDTGGTSSTLTNIPHDSTNAAATAVVRAYTANPTLGTAVGTIRVRKMFVNSLGAGASDVAVALFNDSVMQPIVLRGVAEILAFNLNSVSVAGGSFDMWVTWTEE